MTTPTLPPRVALLARLVARQGGEWTPARVADLYTARGCKAPKGTTHKADLELLRRMGRLDRHERPSGTYYVPSRRVVEGQVAA